MNSISGMTRTVFVVADPVEQLRTPQALNALWLARGIDLVTVPAHVADGRLGAFLEGLRSDSSTLGAVVTVPHKLTAADLCDELGPNSRISRAVNAIRREPGGRLVGETFDGLGFVAGLLGEGIDPRGMTVAVLGAGGAASAVAAALAASGVMGVRIVNRSLSRAVSLAERIRRAYPDLDVRTDLGSPDEFGMLVNATTVGMRAGDSALFDVSVLPPTAVVADVIASIDETPLLRDAAALGLRIHVGRHMLQGQTTLIADFLTAP